jgi:hypothetical protein
VAHDDVLIRIPTSEFDYNILLDQLRGYRYPRNKIGSLLESGRLIRVKKGLYVKAEGGFSPPVLANMIYGPSYVSQHYALSLYALIPERVHTVTSMTLGRKKLFETPVGRFTYAPLPARYFPVGVRRNELTPTQAFLIASPEKALVDILWKRTDLNDPQMLREYLINDLRIDLEMPDLFSMGRMREIERAYRLPVVTALAAVITSRRRT